MIRRNTAGQVIYLPQLTTADGTAITADATLTVAKDGSESGSAGTLVHSANGVWKYTPTQAETDAAIVALILTAASAVPVVLNLVTTAADTAAVAFGANTTTPPTVSAVADEVQTRTIARVTLVDTCTANSDMRGTDGAYTGTPPTAAAISSQVASDLAAAHGAGSWSTATGFATPTTVSDTQTAILAKLPESGRAATQASVDTVDGIVDEILIDTGTTLPAQIAGIDAGSGSGARTVTITVTDGTDPLQNARVRLTEGANTFTALTNVSGVATLNVDDATYTVAVTKSSYSFAGASLVVDGDETQTYAMTLVSVAPPSDPDLCAVTIPVVDQYGAALAGEDVEIRFNAFTDAATATAVVLSPPPVQVSDANGLVSVNLLRLASYSVFYGEGTYKRRLDFSVPDAGSFTVSE